MIYLDYQATTPVAPEAAKAMGPWIEEKFANPHSPSRWGREAAAAIEMARKQVEQAIGLTGGRVAFTGSATEALNWALKGTMDKAPKGRNRIAQHQGSGLVSKLRNLGDGLDDSDLIVHHHHRHEQHTVVQLALQQI